MPYLGLMATDTICAHEVMISIPSRCLLTTRVCFFSDIQKVFEEHASFFSPSNECWEENIFWAFLLYEHQKGASSDWFLLLQNLPRDIDYMIFWSKSEMTQTEDQGLVREARLLRSDYDRDYAQLVKILKKYPKWFSPEAYRPENAKWIYCHIVTRCFGKDLKNMAMVPFVELLNHECVDVYYDFVYSQGNPLRPPDYSQPSPKMLSAEWLQSRQTSDASDSSFIYSEEGDCLDEAPKQLKQKQLSQAEGFEKGGEKLKGTEKTEILSKIKDLEEFVH